ncbi:hypothetical protein ROZALSC1DRAFT_27113 [Rozella allomycis CSF55]|uniref:Uncharacterized protein n=1 Tax=Rozella allomycis (strain CSF55) TaxID=988480 RepID=A0A4P9YPN8_ROZAC|nr:hypothetical protein ROZALSC1DRAFT_27113 [Rozella allomycis CSF55]
MYYWLTPVTLYSLISICPNLIKTAHFKEIEKTVLNEQVYIDPNLSFLVGTDEYLAPEIISGIGHDRSVTPHLGPKIKAKRTKRYFTKNLTSLLIL